MLAQRLAEAYRLIAEMTGRVERLTGQVERLTARVGELERQAGRDSSTSSRPPSSGSPYRKKSAGRSLRERGKRRPGKQPGDPGTTMNLIDNPDERFEFPPAVCGGCGAGLAGEPVVAQRRHQVTDIEPAPAPKVTEYVAQAKECPGCGTVTEGELPAHVRARASFGPEAIGGATGRTLLVVDDPDAVFHHAVTAGATATAPPANEHGWRLARITDPFGHKWEIGRPLGTWPPP